jgi:hypothetical protein
MKPGTNASHDHVMDIGKSLGLHSEREASLSRGGTAYAPRLDILWTRRLSPAQLKALEAVQAKPPMRGDALPLAAWEVEGSDASTKGMQADLANMRVFGAPFGFLAVRGGTENNLYERACRLTRTQRHHFGDQAVVPLDTRWLSELAQITLSPRITSQPVKTVKGGGGEGKWAPRVRAALREQGEQAGFEVVDSFKAPLLNRMTRSEIDVAWTLPMPVGLRVLAEAVAKRDPDLVKDELLVAERYDRVVVVAFEIENDSSKHGHGGLLNLASHGMAGVFIAGTKEARDAAKAARHTYRHSLPLSRVTVNGEFAG